ncbi:MAG: hypothetical protein M1839_000780 [Geoglossum umbratile]|nr:MAG: hypothetical protein M1839_000780 [Geoglossum umbratile]
MAHSKAPQVRGRPPLRFSQSELISAGCLDSTATRPSDLDDVIRLITRLENPDNLQDQYRGRPPLRFLQSELISAGCLDSTVTRPSDLDNMIHPIFRLENFDIPQDQYQALAPALRLASLLIINEHCIDWWASIYTGRLAIVQAPVWTGQWTAFRRYNVLFSAKYITRGLITATKKALLDLANNISFRFKLVPDPRRSKFGSQRRSKKNGRQKIKLSKGFQDFIESGSIANASLSQQLRFFFFFAINAVHEVAHAFYDSRKDESKTASDPHFLPEMEAGILDPEIGACWERCVFGGRIQPNVAGPDKAKSAESCFYGLRRFQGAGDEDNVGAIPMVYICSMMLKSRWDMVKKRGICELNCPEPTVYAMNAEVEL